MSNRISIDRELCINYRYTRTDCRRCREACPELSAADEARLGERCAACGLCVSACPTEAVMLEGLAVHEIEKLLAEPGTVIFRCSRQQEGNWPCLGFLDVRLLLALAYSHENDDRQVIVDNSGCAACKPHVAQYLDHTIEQVNRFLQASGRRSVIYGAAALQTVKAKTISRRQFFSSLFGSAVATVREVVAPGLLAFQRLPRFAWFERFVRSQIAMPVMQQTAFKTLTMSSLCDGCGICAGVCQRKALTSQVNGQNLEFEHDPLQCSGCNVCIKHCPQAAIQFSDTAVLAKQKVRSVELPVCRDCGVPFQPIGGFSVCMDCLLKDKIQSIW
ncbi:MAG: 4Fe-4S binding protein [Negativicutes bacterium]|nr:4Fe-4S binding protein [Negativicutes bacterium]